ncbi:MAG: type IVB secretion system coupling complex protein DotM/IcmP [Francisellaceae bacterium]
MSNEQSSHMPHLIYYALVLGLVVVALFIYFHDTIMGLMITVKLFEARSLGFFVPTADNVVKWILHTPVQQVSIADIYAISSLLGHYLRWLDITIGFIAIVLLYRYHPGRKHITRHSRQSLVGALSREFPQTAPVLDKNLEREDINSGAWRMAETPLEYLKSHALLDADHNINAFRLHELLVEQIGRPWRGIEELTDVEKALFGVLAAFVNYDRAKATSVMEPLNNTALDNKPDFTAAHRLAYEYIDSKAVKKCIHRHYYVYTMMTEMLELARKSGTVASANFLWLKVKDRHLWYVLNNVGRHAVFIEAAAVRAHHQAESLIGVALKEPVVYKVCDALYQKMKQVAINDE